MKCPNVSLFLITACFVSANLLSPSLSRAADDSEVELDFQKWTENIRNKASEHDEFLRQSARDLADVFEKHAIHKRDDKGKATLYLPKNSTDALSSDVQNATQMLTQYFYDKELAFLIMNKGRAGALSAVGIVGPFWTLWMSSAYFALHSSPILAKSGFAAGIAWLVGYGGLHFIKEYRAYNKVDRIEENPEYKKKVIAQEGPALLRYSQGLLQFSSYFLSEMERRGFRFKTVNSEAIHAAEAYDNFTRESEMAQLGMGFGEWINHAPVAPVSKKMAKLGNRAAKLFVDQVGAVSRGESPALLCELWLTD